MQRNVVVGSQRRRLNTAAAISMKRLLRAPATYDRQAMSRQGDMKQI
jgi:hypothetical protein